MKFLKLCFLLSIIGCSNIKKFGENTTSIFSGSIFMESEKICTIEGGINSGKLNCELKFSEDSSSYYYEIGLQSLSLKEQPTCIFEGHTIPKSEKKTLLSLTLISSDRLWVKIPEYKENEYNGQLIGRFICTK